LGVGAEVQYGRTTNLKVVSTVTESADSPPTDEAVSVVKPKRTTKPDGSSCNVVPYKDVMGRYRTESLFYETMSKGELDREVYWPIFTLEENPKRLTASNWYFERYPHDPQNGVVNAAGAANTIPSLRQIYLKMADPAEYDFAMTVFKSDRHWKILTNCAFFQPYLEEWRTTLRLKLRSEGIKTLRELALSGPGPQALQAGKWLAEMAFEPRAEKGRPSAKQVAVETRVQVEQNALLMEDAERMGIKLTNG
jgi:hypothetical protein